MNLIIRQILAFIAYLFLQVFLFNNFTIGGVATPHVFLIFLLMLPLNLPFKPAILIGFFVGLMIDLFSSNLLTGVHAFSCVLMMSLRLTWVEAITTRIAFRGNEDVFLKTQPFTWYINYLFPLILIHHIAYYMLEAFGFQHFGTTILKMGTSSIFTFVICLLLTLLLYTKSSSSARR